MTAYYLLFTAHCLLLTTDYLLLTAYCLIRTAYYLLLTIYYLLLTSDYLLLTTYYFPIDKVCLSYRVLWNTFKRIASHLGLSPEEKHDLFFGTAARVYKLELTSV